MNADLQNSAKFNVYAIQNKIHFSPYLRVLKHTKIEPVLFLYIDAVSFIYPFLLMILLDLYHIKSLFRLLGFIHVLILSGQGEFFISRSEVDPYDHYLPGYYQRY